VDAQLDLIRELQAALAPIGAVLRAASLTGEIPAFLMALPLIVWCVDFRTGVRITTLFLLCAYVSICVKDLVALPRPFDLDPALGLSTANGFGFPSNHASSAIVIWGGLAVWLRRRWFTALAVAIVFIVGVSRVYLGVHFPTDVLGGWAIGGLLLAAHTRYEARLLSVAERMAWRLRLAVVALGPVAMVALHPVPDVATLTGALCGAGVGLVLMYRYAPFTGYGSARQRIWRYPVAILGVAAIYVGLKAFLPAQDHPLYASARFVRFGLIGAWIALGAPWLFRLTGLAPRELPS